MKKFIAIFIAITIVASIGAGTGIAVEKKFLQRNIEICSIEETEDGYIIDINWTANQYVDNGHPVDADIHEYIYTK